MKAQQTHQQSQESSTSFNNSKWLSGFSVGQSAENRFTATLAFRQDFKYGQEPVKKEVERDNITGQHSYIYTSIHELETFYSSLKEKNFASSLDFIPTEKNGSKIAATVFQCTPQTQHSLEQFKRATVDALAESGIISKTEKIIAEKALGIASGRQIE